MGWINEVDEAIWHEIYKRASKQEIMRTDGTAAYSLEEGKEFQHITKVYNDGSELPRLKDPRPQTTGYFRGSDGKLNIYPVPANDSVAGWLFYIGSRTKHMRQTILKPTQCLPNRHLTKCICIICRPCVNHTARRICV